YMNTAGMSVGTLADETGLDDSTIKRYLRENKNPPDVPIIVALCIALHLLPMCSEKLLRSAGRVLSSSKRDRIYQLLLNTAYTYSVHDCNIFLKELGFRPLTNK
ncbi:MAG: helix-turn-helix domain-containing protein, partial [Clostridiales bacterium]|nr:helix-turn-helix domain-containing protein [Clostridiales bacterium]